MDPNTEKTFLGSAENPVVAPTQDEKTVAMLAHLLTFVASILAPLIIYLIKKDESQFVATHAKESLNFQITMVIACIVLAITIIGLFLIWIVGLFALVCVIVATIRANEGKIYRYPFTLRLIK
ncbi:DUF4870 domain-containing protein [Pinibacter soli]|uniref:DUF4870 domain-containing protein n=1 Tax=Pinibacter soli TaxID=3044211 RepID=A0ABT6RIT5_9BACT|nr:DUF4870 domain-containing protein [Pinibacter soli]MDI3322478.1 DUF4870 domain-containing protein [Pinibacter soli]